MTFAVATLILPCEDNDRNSLIELHNKLCRELAAKFGGFTRVPVYGGWLGPDDKYYEDRSFEYRVAMSEERADEWRSIAFRYGRAADQLSLYVTYPSEPNRPVFLDLDASQSVSGLTEVLEAA